MRRIAVLGSGGAGKSRLAVELGRRLGLPVIHLDPLFWRPGWVETPHDEWRQRQQELVAAPEWIIDGTHRDTLDVRLGAADTVVLLDFSRWRCTWRVVRRSISHRGRPRFDRAEGCSERLDRAFLTWVWTFPTRSRPELLDAIRTHADGATLITLRSPRQVKRFVRDLSRTHRPATTPRSDDGPP
jgi:adenylate kinase family enzyme